MTAIYGPIVLGAPRKRNKTNKLWVKNWKANCGPNFSEAQVTGQNHPQVWAKKNRALSSLLSSFHLGFNFALFSALLFSLHFALVSFFFPFFRFFSPFLLFSLLSSLFPRFYFSSDHSHFAVKGIKLLGFLLKEHWNPIEIVFHGAQNSIESF